MGAQLLANESSSAKQMVAIGDPFELPTKPKSCVIQDDLRVASRIFAAQYQEVRPEYMSLIGSFNVTRGQSVKKGQLLATAVTSNLEKMRDIYQDYAQLYLGQLRIATNSRKVIEARRERIKNLTEKGVMAASELEQVDSAVVSAKQVEERMQRGLESMQKNVDAYSVQIKQSNFFSSIDGVVTELIVDPKSLSGNLMVMAGTVIAKIEKPGRYRAEAQLFDSQVHGVAAGMNATVTLPDGTTIVGKVTEVSTLPTEKKVEISGYSSYSYQNESETKATGGLTFYRVIVEFDRAGAILPPNLLADVSIIKSTHQAKSCLPWNAIQIVDGKPSIQILEDGKGWSRIPVRLGKRGRYDVEVETPLAASTVVKSRIW
jgi:multidrug efflux pump subunit AcrA (membrane-fusion protein)